jgi:hypothetical protein
MRVIFAIDTPNKKQSESLHNALFEDLQLVDGLEVTSAQGQYRYTSGEIHKETCFVVNTSQSRFYVELHSVLETAKDFNQESVLLIDSLTDQAFLLYLDGRIEATGVFTRVDETEALKNGCYTLINGEYYITKGVSK